MVYHRIMETKPSFASVAQDDSVEPDREATEDVIDRIMNMVDDRVDHVPVSTVPAPTQAPEPTCANLPVSQPVVRQSYPEGQCWHFDDECDARARWRLHMKKDAITTGVEYAHRHMREYPHMNQLCDKHFNDPSYYLQRLYAVLIERI